MAEVATNPRIEIPRLACVCCGKQTIQQARYCTHCQAPLEVSKAVHRRSVPPQFIPVLGPSGAGKTVFLGLLLDMLSKGLCSLRGLPNGPFSLRLQQETVSALEERRFPQKTPTESDNWKWVHCEVSSARKPSRVLDIVTPDLAGEAIAMEVEQEGTFPIIQSVVSRSVGLVILFDARRARDEGRIEDLFAMKLMTYLANACRPAGGSKAKRVSLPISIVLTKADCCPEALEDPAAFAAATMPGLVQACQRHLARHQFFACSVVGSHAMATDSYGRRMHVPLHVEPRGVMEPLEWIIKHIS